MVTQPDLAHKTVLVTGSSHGIGKAITLALANCGCNVVACASGKHYSLDALRASLSAFAERAVVLQTDVLTDNLDFLIAEATGNFGGVDILVNNVGGGGRWGNEDPLQTDEEVWNDVFYKNVTVARKLIIASLPYMKRKGWGRVITISSISGKESGGRPWFVMSKAAQIAMMKAFSRDSSLVRCNITFNTVAPGAIFIEDTGWETMSTQEPQKFQAFVESLPMGKLGIPEDVANVVVFLCSEKTRYINGSCITVDGGESRSY